jgi:hypothetical protein
MYLTFPFEKMFSLASPCLAALMISPPPAGLAQYLWQMLKLNNTVGSELGPCLERHASQIRIGNKWLESWNRIH